MRKYTITYRALDDGGIRIHEMRVAGYRSFSVQELYAKGFEVDVPGYLVSRSSNPDDDCFIAKKADERIDKYGIVVAIAPEWTPPPNMAARPAVRHSHIAPSRILQIDWEEDV